MEKRVFAGVMVFVCFCGVVFGESVSVDRARRVGVRQRNRSNFERIHSMEKSGTIEQFSEADIVETHVVKDDDGAAVYYVFNLRPEGWVVVAADDVACPVLAHSDEGMYPVNAYRSILCTVTLHELVRIATVW